MRHTRSSRARRATIVGSSSLLLVATAVCAFAQVDAVTPIDAAEFARRFAANNPHFDALDADVDAREADVTAAGAWQNPSLSYEREQILPAGEAAAENTVSLGWSVDVSGRRSRHTRSARAQVRAARMRGQDAKHRAVIHALGVFYDAAHARARVAELRAGRDPLARMVVILAARVKEGDAAGYDLARLELALAAYDARIADADSALREARHRLGGLLGAPAALYDANDPLTLPATPADVTALATGAFDARADYRATSFDLASAAATAAAADRGWIPTLDLGLGFKTADVGTETATGYVAMVGIELPLLTRGRAESERARAHRRAAAARRAQLERDIPAAVRVAHAQLVSAIEQAHTFRTAQLEPAAALVGKAEAVYQAGEASVVELLDAYRTAADTRLHYLALLRRAKAAQLSLYLALGRMPEHP